MAATLPRQRFIVRGPSCTGNVCLTFDDGPHPQHTPRLLDVLKEHGAKATFFMIGRDVEAHPAIVRRALAEGHAVGGHSFTHGEPGATSAKQLVEEADRTERLFEQIIGRRSTLFRPPHGKLTAGKLLRLWRAGQRVVLWNLDPKDFTCRSAAELAGRFSARGLRGGDMVLLHDNVPHAAEILPEIIGSARRNGIEFATVTEWVQGR
jgi:peptidoglycan/xylan/chitin deacetylase (PgdA/CDA1 family)